MKMCKQLHLTHCSWSSYGLVVLSYIWRAAEGFQNDYQQIW